MGHPCLNDLGEGDNGENQKAQVIPEGNETTTGIETAIRFRTAAIGSRHSVSPDTGAGNHPPLNGRAPGTDHPIGAGALSRLSSRAVVQEKFHSVN